MDPDAIFDISHFPDVWLMDMTAWLLHTWMSRGMDGEDVPQVVRRRVHLISSSLSVYFTLPSLAFGVAHSPITASSLALGRTEADRQATLTLRGPKASQSSPTAHLPSLVNASRL